MSVQYYTPSDTPEIFLSPAAIKRLLKVAQSTAHAICIRLSLKKSGCSGYRYDFQALTAIPQDDYQLPLNEQIVLVIDKKAYPLFKGLKIDYIKQGLQSKFSFENPNESGHCGCGESFSVK
ncbi:MAG: iron-sulfur cluster assembly accessory protein [Gammaproteobacteria bacterium]|nr:iron-sulfur cluster assembly accessory protein [Gammaproteobacteria bacterium]